LTLEGRERLRQAALTHKPWLSSTGPTTPEGKTVAAANGLKNRRAEPSVRQLRAGVTDARTLIAQMVELRSFVDG
jgi:hypothetical protein